jgi:ActR/RegA family two-component response regulator
LGVLSKPVPVVRLLGLAKVARRDAVVAIVEDDLALADNLSEALQQAGFATVIATSVEDVRRIQTRPFAAVVDMRLQGNPDGSGLATLREQFADIPLLVVTGYSDLVPGHQGHVFLKPFQLQALLAAIQDVYDHTRAA